MTEEENKKGPEGDSTNHGLPHWSEPATGQFPKVEVNKGDEPNEDWEALSEGPDWGQGVDPESTVNEMQRIDVTIGEDGEDDEDDEDEDDKDEDEDEDDKDEDEDEDDEDEYEDEIGRAHV